MPLPDNNLGSSGAKALLPLLLGLEHLTWLFVYGSLSPELAIYIFRFRVKVAVGVSVSVRVRVISSRFSSGCAFNI